MKNMRKSILVTALGLALCAGGAQAALQAVDPGPYTAATGFFPQWYQDIGPDGNPNTADGLALDLCLSKAQSTRVPGAPGAPSYMCTLLPNPGVFDDTQPIVFPTNWPDEAFWFTADANVVGQGIDLIYVAALEAAFGAGLPAPGDQVSFSRIRVRADFDVTLPTPGTYAIVHPYGVEIFTVAAPGRRVINATRDIGIGAPGDFTGALVGDIGPFLRSVNLDNPTTGTPCEAVLPLAYVETNPETGGLECYVGDPNLLEPVTGSPFGTNFLRIVRVNPAALPDLQPVGDIDVSTNEFAISGRVFNNQAPTPVTVDRASYSRTVDPVTQAVTTQIDAFATSSPTADRVCFRETLELANGTDACTTEMTGDGTGKFFGQNPAAAAVPAFIVVTASYSGDPNAIPPIPATSPTSIAQSLGDVLRVSKAQYAKDTGILSIEATSSDKAVPPKMTAVGLGVLTPGACAIGLQRLQVALPPAEPPAFVTLVSSGGGRQTEPVTVVPTATAVPNASAPLAVDDSATTNEDTPVVISVLANDTDPDCDVLSVTEVTQGASGSVTTNGTTVTYSPNANFVGPDSFTYTVSDGLNTATATVSVTVNNLNDAPVANPDGPLPATEDTPLAISHASLLTNDADVDGDVLVIANFNVQGLAGTLTLGDPLTFTPNLNFSGTTSFSYQVRDPSGALSNFATVTIAVAAVNDAPVAVNDTANTASGTPVTINVLANDTDVDNAQTTLTVVNVGNLVGGTAVVNANNTVTYTPNAGFSGAGSFTYQAQDPGGALSNIATVAVQVAAGAGVDLDIDRLTVPNSVRRPATVTPQLRVVNNGAVNQPRNARIIGVTQAGAVFYDETRPVQDAPGGGATNVTTFPASQSTTAAGPGVITWTATISDDDPDVDQATATTTVR